MQDKPPEHFRKIPKTGNCRECEHYKYSQEIRWIQCKLHNFALPKSGRSADLANYVCNDFTEPQEGD